MRLLTATAVAALLCHSVASAYAQNDGSAGQSEPYRTQFIPLAGNAEALLYEPAEIGPNARIALVFSHPNRNNFTAPLGAEMSSRGYRVLMVNNRADRDDGDVPPETYLPSISYGIAALRAMPDIESVVLVGHSGGGHLGTLYQNVAENGPAACQGPEKIYPCDGEGLENLEVPDGFVLLDPTLGAAHQMSAVDPAVAENGRNPELDMLEAANGFAAETGSASYSPEFAERYYQAQAARNNALVEEALARLAAIEAGEGEFSNDEPLLIRGMGVRALGARLYQPDTTFSAHTKAPHLLLRADGSQEEVIVQSVRAPLGQHARSLDELGSMNYDTTVRGFLANSAIWASEDFAFTEDDITGVDWASSYTSTPSNAQGVTVPSLVVTMGCHYLIVPGEIIYDNLASTDKSYATVEGATHLFQPCKPEYGDTTARTFDYVDEWLATPDRF